MSGAAADTVERVADLVEAARAGDRRAFDVLVVRFQDMAVGTAYGWLRDPDAAQDAAQEAFVEAYLHLNQLNEPAAFPGFLRRIVLKHCDRRTRGRGADVVSLDAQRAQSVGPPPDASLAEREDRARVRAAVEELPAHERLVVALHYLGGLTQSDVADWLELPLSTVKKRLHSARRRLRGGWDDMLKDTFDALRPSRNAGFSDTIQLFLGIREGDVPSVRALLEHSPDLVEAEERWDSEITRTHALPVPNGGTPLVRAAARNQVEMIDLLLEHGAEIDRPCSCAGGERPLWAAIVSGQVDAARRLLERGADPDTPAFAGHAPLHVAALRGFEAIVALLLEHSADPARRDRRGRTPADWAQQNGHAAIVRQLTGSATARESEPATARPVEVLGSHLVETGIKALDLFAPLAAGAIVRSRFEPGQGAIVLLAEISLRWWNRTSSSAPAVVWVGWERQPSDLGEIEGAVAELGLDAAVRLVWSPASDDADQRRGTLDAALDEALRLQEAGAPEVLVVVFARRGFGAEVDAALPRVGRRDGRSITLIVAERDGDPAGDEVPLAPPFDARIAFDSRLASMSYFPAVHPLASRSKTGVDPEHARLADEARALLAGYRALVPDLGAGDTARLTKAEQELVGRARRLQAYLTQPFLSAESFSGEPGSVVPLAETLKDVARILAGELDEADLTQIGFRGRLD